jgi:transposase
MNESTQEHKPDTNSPPETAAQLVRTAKRYGRRKISAEDKIRIVMEGLRGEQSIEDLCRREGIGKWAYYGWLKSFMEGGKKRLSGDYQRQANEDDVKSLRRENETLKQLVAELTLEVRVLKKSLTD